MPTQNESLKAAQGNWTPKFSDPNSLDFFINALKGVGEGAGTFNRIADKAVNEHVAEAIGRASTKLPKALQGLGLGTGAGVALAGSLFLDPFNMVPEGRLAKEGLAGKLAERLAEGNESRLARAAEQGFDTSKKWFHGTQRPDRVVEAGGFSKAKATSGPMAYFTNSPEMASTYSTAKRDTSLGLQDPDYRNWFLMKVKGSRTPVDLDRAWYFLEPEQKKAFLENINSIGLSDEGRDVVKGLPDSGISPNSFNWELKQAVGNGLKAAKETWLTSGALYNDEEKFMDVLKHAGLDPKMFTYADPNAVRSGVFPVYLKMQNPLDTSRLDVLKESVIPALEEAVKRQGMPKFRYGVDPWDKTVQNPGGWLETLKEDVNAGNNSIAWTSIPDWVTRKLKTLGYDGILDAGGKFSHQNHAVAVPFEGNQIRSVFAKFDPAKAKSRNLLASMMGALMLNQGLNQGLNQSVSSGEGE